MSKRVDTTTIFQSSAYAIRSSIFLVVVYGAAIFLCIQNEWQEYILALLLAFVFSSSILVGAWGFISSLVIGVSILVLNFSGVLTVWLQTPSFTVQLSGQQEWLISGFIFISVSAVTVIPLLVFLKNLQRVLESQKEYLYQLEDEKANLKEQVSNQTTMLERHLLQLRTAADISRSISSLLDPDELLQQVVELLTERAHLYYAGVFLLDDSGKNAVLRAGSGAAGQAMMAEGHHLQVGGSSMIGWSTATGQARIALDVGEEAVRFQNPHLPETRSEMALPILFKERIIGALTIQSELPNAFDQNDILVLQGIADSLAVAIENAALFQQNQNDLEEIRALNRRYLEQAWAEANIHGDLLYDYVNTSMPYGSGEKKLQMPISIREQPIGKITLNTGDKELSSAEIAVIEAITTQTALALESARLLEETQRRARFEEQVNQITADFWRATEIKSVITTALNAIGKIPAVSEVSVRLMPEETSTVEEPGNGCMQEGDV
jgi:GAF domain-containing protein